MLDDLDEIDRILAEANKENSMDQPMLENDADDLSNWRCGHNYDPRECPYLHCKIRESLKDQAAQISDLLVERSQWISGIRLRELCLAYDREVGTYPESEYEGLALLLFSENGTSNGSEVWARANQDRLNAWRGEVNKKEE